MEGLAGLDWEAGAKSLPVPKKSFEGTFVAVAARMSMLVVRGLETASTNVTQRDTLVELVLMRLGFWTIFFVEFYAYVVLFHICFRDTFNMRARAGSSTTSAGFAFARAAALLAGSGGVCDLGIRVPLGNHGEVRPEVHEPFLDGGPIVGEVKLAHLPCLMHMLVSLQHIRMLISEAHIY